MNKTHYVPNRYVAATLGIFLGGLGIHHFYMGRNNVAVPVLLTSLLLSWTVVVPLVMMTIGFFQGVTYLFYTDQKWRAKLFTDAL